jgi:hypothetical protein
MPEASSWRRDLPMVDAHLDLAENVTLFGLDLTISVAERSAMEKLTARQATVSLPELERGGIAVVIATVTAGFLAADVGADFVLQSALYHTPGLRPGRKPGRDRHDCRLL